MLYLSTRSKAEIFTDHRALNAQAGPDVGFFVPRNLPAVTEEMLQAMAEKSFGQRLAEILNSFFRIQLTGWDVELAIGRRPVRISAMSHKIAVAEAWHNLDHSFHFLVARLYGLVEKNEHKSTAPGAWFALAVRIGILFALFGDLMNAGIATVDKPIDIALAVGDFSGPMAAWYARKMGLPLGRIICCCNDNSGLWELLNYGQMNGGARIVATSTPRCDAVVPVGVERLIFETLGYEQTQKFVEACMSGGVYALGENQLLKVREGLFCAVVRRKRLDSVIDNVYHTNHYRMDPYTALAYGGVQDYRAATSETGAALILSDNSPNL